MRIASATLSIILVLQACSQEPSSPPGDLANAEVDLARGGSSRPYLAIPVDEPAAIQWLNEAMARKYGVSDTMVGLFADHGAALPFRLDPETP